MQRLHRMEKRKSHITTNVERIRTIIERILTGKDAFKDRIAEELVLGEVEPGSRADEQVAVRHADASGGYIMEKQHAQKRKRDIQEAARKNKRTNGGRQYDVSKKVRVQKHLPIHMLLWNIRGAVLVQKVMSC